VKRALILALCAWALGSPDVASQTQPVAHYADGQVWVVWKVDPNVVSGGDTYAIYAGPTAFTDTSQAVLIGRVFFGECTGATLKNEVNTAYGSPLLTGFVIPAASGGDYMLKSDEGVFAATVRSSGASYFAVVPFGQSSVAAAERTASAISFNLSVNNPPRPHLQIRANSLSGHPISFFALWVDGAQDETGGRADFPILANAAKRGVGHTFMVVEPEGGLTTPPPWPATVALHGGNGSAIEWLPNDARGKSIGVAPVDGLLIAFDDDLYRVPGGAPITTGHLGYARQYDPFVPGLLPAGSTIVNYTQRRYIWVLDWLAAHRGLDPHRISLLGHSNGAQGAMMLARVFPEHFSNVQLFNCSMSLFADPIFITTFGSAANNFPTTVINRFGETVRMLELTAFAVDISPVRDLPFHRHYAGKCDDNNQRQWRSVMLDQMRWSDQQGTGLHFYWDLRDHGPEQWRDYWVDATTEMTLQTQTRRDDVRAQVRYRNDQSYPAFCNVQSYSNHGDPGPGYIGGSTNMSPCGRAEDENGSPVANGDDHGTWGGYFEWDTTSILDTPTAWQCTAALVGPGTGYAPVDASPFAVLTADITIRRPQQFSLSPGSAFIWTVRSADLSTVLQSGSGTAGPEGLVRLAGVNIPRDPDQVVIRVESPPQATPTPTPSPTPSPTPTPTPAPGVAGNVATRLPVGIGDNVLIEGFIVLGPNGSTKKIMVRALGPFLSQFGVTDALANPTLEIRDGSNTIVGTNDDWRNTQVGGIITSDQAGEIEGSGLAPSNDLEAAIIADLAPGNYTAVVRGVNNTVGTGIVDAYDMSPASPARLANIATRGLIQPGDQLMIAGFITQQGNVKAVIRAIGPSLSGLGISNALPDTTLQLRDVNGAIVRENDDWESHQKVELEATGLQPGNALEAAIVETLPPGQYTAQVRGKPESIGIGVVEIYFLQ
jgi:pimeloyl-ACP methyl ester carboxylesterase